MKEQFVLGEFLANFYNNGFDSILNFILLGAFTFIMIRVIWQGAPRPTSFFPKLFR